jgi:hypothetical protein
MLEDGQGLAVSTNSRAAIAAVNQFVDQSLSYGNQAEACIHEAIAADPTWGIAHAYAAAYYLCLETTPARQRAIPYLHAAQQCLSSANGREKLYIQAIVAWANGNVEQAINYHQAIAEAYPWDLVSVQAGQYHYFYQGNQRGLLNIAERVLPANRGNHYLLGMLAFALEQSECLIEAEAVGRQAIAINPDDPWAQHAVAHVMATQGRAKAGIAWMEQFSHTWHNCNSLLYTHNWWHIALFYLDQQDWQRALSLFDTHVWGMANQTSPKDQVGAISLLLRLELQANKLGYAVLRDELHQRWQTLVPYLLPRLHEHCLPFQDLHYVYALARAGQSQRAQEMLLSMNVHAQRVFPFGQQVWQEIVLPAAHGMIAHACGDWLGAIATFKPLLAQLHRVGGSRAQQKLFEQIYSDALLKAEKSRQQWHRLMPVREYNPAVRYGLNAA